MSSLKTPQVLELDPPTELIFRGPFNEIVTTSLKLTNPTNEKVGFKVKTTAPKQYCVRPNSGIIESHNEQQVSVMLQPLEDISLAERMKHKFMVQSMCVDDSISPDILDDAMRKADKKKLMDSKLKCSFVEGDISEQPSSSSKADTISASSFESSEHVLAPDNKSSEASLDNTPVTTITPSEQPTAGSTPGHNTGRQSNVESEHVESELRLLRDRAKKLTEENKTLKTETDRLRQQFLTQSTTVKPNRLAKPPSSTFALKPFNAFALLLIFIALVMGYLIGSRGYVIGSSSA